MQLLKSWTASSIDDSRQIASELSHKFTSGDVVLLQGTLGAGKTFLVQQICKQWHVNDDVTSPTFTLIQNYNGDLLVNHIDLYRIEDIDELDQIGWEDMVYSDAVTFIEWPEKVETILNSFYKISIEQEVNTRYFKLFKK
jgi:tRNA threonylcarbamoyladenosine biosynthesis protein TsaE